MFGRRLSRRALAIGRIYLLVVVVLLAAAMGRFSVEGSVWGCWRR